MKSHAPSDFIIGEAAPGIATLDAVAVNRKEDRQLYASRPKVYSRLARGTFRNLKWVVMAVTLGIYYALPWFRWDRGPELPNQALLIDVANGRIFIGPVEIWPQELYFVTGLLMLASLGLFLVTAALGRVWCGYACPQTVWTDLMVAIERFWQGDRNARMRLDKEPWSASKIRKKVMTHISWALVGVLTGGAFVFYFRDAPTLMVEFLTGTAPMIAYLFLGLFAATTYLLGAISREQVCIYMCPWPRIQGAMTDGHTMLVSYVEERGEPRGPVRKGKDGTIDWSNRGDCIDCRACVAVCPTGIDIRDGSQLECIQCALCIDACDEIMTKIGRPKGLVRYDTIAKQEAAAKGQHASWSLVRPRTLLYLGSMVIVAAVMAVAFVARTTLEINVISDRAPLFVQLSDGGVRNGFTVKILNKEHAERRVRLRVEGLPGAEVGVLGTEVADPIISIPTDDLREIRVFVSVPGSAVGRLTPPQTAFRFIVEDAAGAETAERSAIFQSPKR
ncbi:MAG: cytochrome c oxidase accessory protein CcoG [Hyphomicrobiaceae bacterium]